jgi:formamidopyrimidine-DNA glycosylase
MPELPEVQTIVQSLTRVLIRRRIDAVRINRQDVIRPAQFDLAAHLAGRSFTHIGRRGKKIILELDDGNRLYIHLGMSGRLSLEPSQAPSRPHTHVILQFQDDQLRFVDPRRFGGIFWLGTDGSADQNLGPEPLLMRPRQLALRLRATRRSIKTALLDQSLIAGLGNIYADEALFTARIHPHIPANKLMPRQIDRLSRAIKQVLRRALRHRGSTLRDYRDANGQAGRFQKLHRVYGREAKPCPRCRTAIKRIVLGGRSTHFCPKCQKRSSI